MADDARGPGHALIRIGGTAADAAPGFRIARPGWPEPNLGPQGWQGAEALLVPDAVRREGAELVLEVGPAVCDSLDEQTYVLTVPSLALEATVFWPAIDQRHGGQHQVFGQARPPAPAAPLTGERVPDPPLVELAPVEPVTPAQPPATQAPVPDYRNPVAPLLGLALLVLAAAGGGAWWWTHRTPAPVADPAPSPPPAPTPPPAPPDPVPPVSAPPPPTPPPPAPPNPDAMAVPALVAANDPAQMLDQARKRLANKPQDSILLLEAAGEDRHFGPALTQLARLYDPNQPRQGGIPADPRQAAKYYRDAARNNDPAGAADRDALRRTLQARRDAGDLNAKLTEQDFWP